MRDLKVLLRLVNGVVIVLLAYLVAHIVLMEFETTLQSRSFTAKRVAVSPTSSKRTIPLSSYNPILTRNIFNSKESVQALFSHNERSNSRHSLTDTDSVILSATNTDFFLRGTLFTASENSLAVFELSDRQQIMVRTGAEITAGVTLAEVWTDRVIINRNGVKEEMEFYREEPPGKTSNYKSGTAGIRKRASNKYEIDKDTLSKSLENVNDIISKIALRPNMKDGACIGYEVRRIKEGSIFEDIGLLKGDILQSVNGMDLSNPEDAFRVYKSLIGETSFNIDLLRNGSRTTLNYEIR
ncbi:type II secretion system protein GspC [candidate division CSSED10-310 bacterium]|uniref:Type II secretion system protein GspC n=1 Tax=candidate division CSSED10-310 bacterium TaxID=2855610 RepID=A0ABV6Z4D1_UNCC1